MDAIRNLCGHSARSLLSVVRECGFTMERMTDIYGSGGSVVGGIVFCTDGHGRHAFISSVPTAYSSLSARLLTRAVRDADDWVGGRDTFVKPSDYGKGLVAAMGRWDGEFGGS